MYPKLMEYEGVDCIHLAQGREDSCEFGNEPSDSINGILVSHKIMVLCISVVRFFDRRREDKEF
jgi:hypothetical protein